MAFPEDVDSALNSPALGSSAPRWGGIEVDDEGKGMVETQHNAMGAEMSYLLQG